MRSPEVLTDAKLRARRKALKMSQAELARRTGYSRDTVRYWEKKGVIEARYGAPQAFVVALELRTHFASNARRGEVLLSSRPSGSCSRKRPRWSWRGREREKAKAAARRVTCGA